MNMQMHLGLRLYSQPCPHYATATVSDAAMDIAIMMVAVVMMTAATVAARVTIPVAIIAMVAALNSVHGYDYW